MNNTFVTKYYLAISLFIIKVFFSCCLSFHSSLPFSRSLESYYFDNLSCSKDSSSYDKYYRNKSDFKAHSNKPTIVVAKNENNKKGNGKIYLRFSHERDLYFEPFKLSLTSSEEESIVIFTHDCSIPTKENGIIYKEGISIDSTVVIKVIAYSAKGISKVYTHSYIFPEITAKQGKRPDGFPSIWGGATKIRADYEMDPEIIEHPDYSSRIIDAFKSLPSLSLSMNIDEWFNPATGLYVGYPNSNISREKAVTAEFLFQTKEENFSVECGVQNQGGTSIINWTVPKQSMRLLFKDIYGPKKLKKKLFTDSEIESINTLVIDGFLNTWLHPWDEKQRTSSLYFKDQLASDLQNEMGGLSFHGRFFHLFLNGLYWGIYDVHERPDDAFLSEYLGADRDDFDIIRRGSKRIVQGSKTSYLKLLEEVRRINKYSELDEIGKHLDLSPFIDYMLLNFYLGNHDWAHHNYYAAKNKKKKTGFRFYSWDAEDIMRFSDVNFNNTLKNDKGGPTEIHTLLKENEEYRIMFADAIYKHLYSEGVLSPEYFVRILQRRIDEIENAIILESARWGDFRKKVSGVTYTKNEHWLSEINKLVTEYIPQRRDIVVKQMQDNSNKLFPLYMPPVFTIREQQAEKKVIVELINPNRVSGDIYFTTNGLDPRNSGGKIRGTKYSGPLKVKPGTILKARFYFETSKTWSALSEKLI